MTEARTPEHAAEAELDRKAENPNALLPRIAFLFCALYSAWHLYVLNIAPLETWTFRIVHIAGALILGFGMSAALSVNKVPEGKPHSMAYWLGGVALIGTTVALVSVIAAYLTFTPGEMAPPEWTLVAYGPALAGGILLAVATSWVYPARHGQIPLADIALMVATVASCSFILFSLDTLSLRLRAGTP
ncbi:MAG: hypothetical protein AAGJ28_24500, partial [Pseudomonadota bacterium]